MNPEIEPKTWCVRPHDASHRDTMICKAIYHRNVEGPRRIMPWPMVRCIDNEPMLAVELSDGFWWIVPSRHEAEQFVSDIGPYENAETCMLYFSLMTTS